MVEQDDNLCNKVAPSVLAVSLNVQSPGRIDFTPGRIFYRFNQSAQQLSSIPPISAYT
jgi:hypothetical protein